MPEKRDKQSLSRRRFVQLAGAGAAVGLGAASWYKGPYESGLRASVFIAKAERYDGPLEDVLRRGLAELGWGSAQLRGKKVLLKPNLVEPDRSRGHVNTHPLLVRAVAETFLRLGAARVTVGEGAGHVRDSLWVLEESGLSEVLLEDRLPFVDLNTDAFFRVPNRGRLTRLKWLALPAALREADLIVSMPKLKTHHWTGVTLSMKNLFGLMPGNVYGWPKNVFHQEGIHESIVDICATVAPGLAIVDGIVGMEGDGPIMGTPRQAGVLVLGANLPAVDATCARLMGVDPRKIPHLRAASGWLGPIRESHIAQRGENWRRLRQHFQLLDFIPAQRGIRLAS
ncbi:MAG: DUF362 domain-containing protein [Bryobacterales bacterium]|nr:DUF362 domain-containing protein [Bryobacteraceae bacterium]MDW8355013.1 DUF362 domain-containing protein [Bryobacterales bacterium]